MDKEHNQYVALRSYLTNQSPHCWIKSAQIQADIGIKGTDLRALCQLYPSVFVSSGMGYKVVVRASKADIQDCVRTLLSRAQKMLSRAAALSANLAR